MKKNKNFNNYVYEHTTKPIEYKYVSNPTTAQDYRQIQFNQWCKAKKVYCGSYLPKNHTDLLKKGWKTVSHNVVYERKSTGQKVRYDYTFENGKKDHYHWMTSAELKKEKLPYYTREKVPCKKYDPKSHLLPNDKDFVTLLKKSKKHVN